MLRSISTSEFAKALGISDSSVRRMADAGELGMHRTHGGHRRIPVAEAVRYVHDNRAQVVQPEVLGLTNYPPEVSDESAAERMLQVLEDGHASEVIGLMQWLYASGMNIADLSNGPIASAMTRIGERWPHDKRAIFLEHRATVLCCRALNQLRLSIPEPNEDAPKAIGGAMSGDMYLMPTLIASLVLYEAGFDEINLGPNTPLDVLADAVIDEAPQLVWLSLAEPVRSKSQLSELIKLAAVAKKNRATFIIGGRSVGELDQMLIKTDSKPQWILCNSMIDLRNEATKLLRA
jgi:MerR family transcriptional regulator, light-induced transcriptional regulator